MHSTLCGSEAATQGEALLRPPHDTGQGELFGEGVDIPQEVNPAPLAQTERTVVAAVKVTDDNALVSLSQYVGDDMPGTGFGIREQTGLWSGETPQIPVVSVFPPPGLITMNILTRSQRLLQTPVSLLPQSGNGGKHPADFPDADFQVAEGRQQRGNSAHGQTSDLTQVSHEGMNLLSEAALPDGDLREVRSGNTAFLADTAVPCRKNMVNNADGDFGEFNELATAVLGSAGERSSTVRAMAARMHHFFRRGFPFPHKGFRPGFARFLRGGRRRDVGLDPLWRFGFESRRRVASRPSMTGICTSISTASKVSAPSRCTSSIACRPFSAKTNSCTTS